MKKKPDQPLKKAPIAISRAASLKKYDPTSAIKKAATLFISLLLIHLVFNLIKNFSKDYNIFDRDWGFNNISYFSPVSFALFYLICIAVCIPVLNKKLILLISRIAEILQLQKLRKIRWLLFIVVSGLSIFVFYFFRIKYDLLGDMDLRIPQTVKKEYVFTEYLTMYTLHYFDAFLHKYFQFPPHESFTLHSFLCGVGYIFFLFLTADALGVGLFQKSVIFLFSAFFGAMLIFFGYVEIYSIPALTVLIYIYSIILCLKDKAHIVFPALALLLALGMHLMNVGLIPSFFLLFIQKYYSNASWVKKFKAKHIIILIFCGLPFMYVLAPMADLGYYLNVLKPTPNQPRVMTQFSFVHFWEFFNGQLLASGSGFFLIVFLTSKAIRDKIIITPMIWLLSSAAFFMFVIAFVSHLVRGSGDWDIQAFPSMIYNILGIYWLLIAYNTKQQFLKYTVLVLITFNILHTYTWIRINNTTKSLSKIKDMLIEDPGSYYQIGINALSGLGFSFKANGLKDESLEYFKQAYEKFYTDPRNHLNYANELLERGNKTEGLAILENALVAAPMYPLPYRVLINIYSQDKQFEKLYRVADRMFQAYTQNPGAFEARIPKNELKNYFNYLYQVESANHNDAKANAIAPYIK